MAAGGGEGPRGAGCAGGAPWMCVELFRRGHKERREEDRR